MGRDPTDAPELWARMRDDEHFRREAARVLAGVDLAAYADRCGASRATLASWRDGRSVPHPALRATICALFARDEARLEWVRSG